MTKPVQLPPPGPAWAGSLMGTSIAATLTDLHGWPVVPWIFAIVAAGIFFYITIGWIMHRTPAFTHLKMGPWGMYAMGILALGSAWASVTGADMFQIVTWWVGTALGIWVCLLQLRGFEGAPNFTWGLALVAPMVGATGGGQLAPEHGPIYWYIGTGCFVLSLVTGIPIFARAYAEVLRGNFVPAGAAAGTAWIPLGIVGQSTAAAQVLFGGWYGVLHGTVMFTVGIVLVAYAASRFWPAVVRWQEYGPGWWGSTFPTGTISLGAHYLSLTTGYAWLDTVSVVFLCLLVIHWSACVARWVGWLTRESPGAVDNAQRRREASVAHS
ncbi:hypothetical protein [Corynebacterium cystitidis]|nr:hypothetical protein [Corynebacterium cystitidis]